ncbi:uncharacterized protein LOC112501558 [Cynara cardunculus var. scolymus]|uniref:uncharacterized protein LOC112501558 n=1 Tax=Cynara cardunculus var. scolymus TaxID=59895 RepID=UPI000D624CE5|nr:uncharacterized protein LOC112501558 [Cynara cardunculus var. scolymus]
MKSDTPLDYAAFQLSPKRSRCELFVSSGGNTEKLASGLLKPFVTHLKVAEEQVALALQSIRLEVDRHKNVESWFTKGTLERFVRFVSTPEVLELVSTLDAEMSQLEAARRIYSQGSSDQLSGGGKSSSATAADATKKELLRAIDVRLATVKQDLATSCARAEAAGFNHETVADLQLFAERFGATRLNQAASKYVSLYHTRPDLFNNPSFNSDQPIHHDPPTTTATFEQASTTSHPLKSLSSSATFPLTRAGASTTQDSTVHADDSVFVKKEEGEDPPVQTSSRRLSVQDRINLFENKQKEVAPATGSGSKPAVTKPDLRRLSSDVSHSNSPPPPPPAVLRRWSGASDIIDLTCDRKDDQKDTPTDVSNDQEIGSSNLSKGGTSSTIQLVKSETSVGSNQLTSTLETTQSLTYLIKSEDVSSESQVKPGSRINSFRGDQVKFDPSTVGPSEESDLATMTLRAPPKKTAPDSGYPGGGSGSKIQEAFAASQQRQLEVGLLRSQPKLNTSSESEEVRKKEEEQIVESGPQKLKFQKQVKKDDGGYAYGYSSTPPSGKLYQGQYGSMLMEASTEQVHRSRQLKGNQELNDELQIKANELEKLFAEHKLRVPGDQPNPTRQKKASDVEPDQITRFSYRKQVADPVLEQQMTFESPVPVMETDDQNHNYLVAKVGFSEELRGNLYVSYMKKRDTRLRELWDSNRAEKEARMKAMHDSLECHTTEMKAKLSWSADRQNSVSSAQRRAERLRSFNARSALKREEPLDFGQLQDDGDLSEFSEMKPSGFCVSRNIQGKKPSPAIPRSAPKLASGSGRRRAQPDNPLAQSVPNFSDLRKENTKPYSTASKAAARSQLRNYTRSRSTNEEVPSVKEEKSRRSQSLRKTGMTSLEISEGVNEEQGEGGRMKFSKTVEPKRFLRKNTGIGPGSGSVIAKMKASMVSEAMNNEEEYDKQVIEPNVIKDDGEEELDAMETEDQDVVDGVESQTSPESEALINSGSENGSTSQSFLQVDHTLVAELPATVNSAFLVQESPGESPMSWNSRTNYPFSYAHEASDADADASPIRSPASWNLQEADAARMRKKWGMTQKPTLANSSGLQSRKDMTKGFKRLLKFGRKSRNTESLADYISATTSEGDDDTEDGRDPANRSSEDLRKSRMGYSQPEVSFNESDFYVNTLQSSIPAPPANFRLREDHLSGSSIKGPRSFFSLSTFRSKGSESKPR